jgi:protein associated with RNAse G/E
MSDEVKVVYRKYDGSLHWHATLRRLGEDEHGVWLFSPADTIWQRGHEPPALIKHAQLSLYPRDAWWVAGFNCPPGDLTHYVDITDVPSWPSPNEVTMVDLDLDVVRRRATGEVLIVDEDEFEEHQIRYGYPPDVIAAARACAEWLADAVTTREPFLSAYRHWLEIAGE